MQNLLLVLSFLILFFITYQDLKYRAVTWLAFPVLFLLGFGISIIITDSVWIALKQTGVNLGFIFLQIALIRCFYILKDGNAPFIDSKIGIGDIYFMMACCSFFPPVSFMIFYTASLIFAILVFICFTKISVKHLSSKTIPLAGLQSVFLVTFLIVVRWMAIVNIKNMWPL